MQVTIRAPVKAFALSGLVVGGLGGLAWGISTVYGKGYDAGQAHERGIQTAAVLAYQRAVADVARRLAESEQARKAATAETVEVIRYVEDPSGCADARIPDGIVDRLRD